VDLVGTEAAESIAETTELELAPAIVLESLAPAVSGVAVDLDHESGGTPEEVDRERAHADVDLRLRQPESATEAEERALELASGVVGRDRAEVEAEELRLAAGRAAQQLGVEVDAAEVGQGASGGCERGWWT
jgi:hypothetical protein